jgi:hypothetical protein
VPHRVTESPGILARDNWPNALGIRTGDEQIIMFQADRWSMSPRIITPECQAEIFFSATKKIGRFFEIPASNLDNFRNCPHLRAMPKP